MKAIVIDKYGSPATLKLKEVDNPSPKKHEVLVKIHATAINDYDWSLVRGKPYIYRVMFGFFKPKSPIPGMELAGTVESIGQDVQFFKPGDAVYGDISDYGFGSFAEYICIHEKALSRKPSQMSFVESTSIPHAALLALQAIRNVGKIAKGQEILINGAGGGVGTFGVQLAKQLQCKVTGVDSEDKLAVMKNIGFDHVIDYRKEDFTKNGRQYHLILDCKTNRSPFAYIHSLKPNGMYVTVGGNLLRLIQILLFSKIISFFSQKKLSILALKPNEGLDYIEELFLQAKLRCIVDGPHSLADVPSLLQYFGEGKHTGKVVIKINDVA